MSVILGTVDDVLTAVPAMKIRAVLRELVEVGAVWEDEPFGNKYTESVDSGELLTEAFDAGRLPVIESLVDNTTVVSVLVTEK